MPSIFVFIFLTLIMVCLQACDIRQPKGADQSSLSSAEIHSQLGVFVMSCMDCHENKRKSATHYPGEDCKGCHTPGTAWAEATNAGHQPTPKQCAACHGVGARWNKYPNGHVPSQDLDCITCHMASITNSFTSFKGGNFPHAGSVIAGTECKSCHEKNRKNATHYTGQDCRGCHVPGAGWANATNSGHQPTPTQCAACHATTGTVNRFPVGHLTTDGKDCITCHRASIAGGFKNFLGAIFEHSPTIIAGKNCASCHASRRPLTGKWMNQDPALRTTDSHYGTYDCFFCHRTTQKFLDWNSSATSHYNGGGGNIESCLPCHFSRQSPSASPGTGPISKHRSDTSYFTAPIYDIRAVGNLPNRTGKLGKCYSCHNRGRRSFDADD